MSEEKKNNICVKIIDKLPSIFYYSLAVIIFVFAALMIATFAHDFFTNTPDFYSSTTTTLTKLTPEQFIPLLPVILITLVLLIILAIVRYRSAVRVGTEIELPSMHPATASYAMRGGFFNPNRIIALTMSHLVRKGVLTIEINERSFVCTLTTNDDSSLTDVDKAVLHFLERIISYRDTQAKKEPDLTRLSSFNIQDFAYTDRKFYNDLIEGIRESFYRQLAAEKIKEKPANLFVSITLVWIIGLFIAGVVLELFEMTTHNTPVLFLVGIFLLSLSICAFIIAYFMLSSGIPWSYRAERQGARIRKTLCSLPYTDIIKNNNAQGYADALSLIDNPKDKALSQLVPQKTIDIYMLLPVIKTRQWIPHTSKIAYFLSTYRLENQKVAQRKIKKFFKEWKDELLFLLPFAITVLAGFYFMIEDQEVHEGNEALRVIGIYMLIVVAIPITSYLLLRIVHFVWNLPARLLFRSKTKYSRNIPDMHPAIVSILNKNGVFSTKRILSSSLLHLVAQGVLSVEKRKNSQGKETVVFIQEYDSIETLDISLIDKAVLKIVDFVIRDRLAKRNNTRIEELGYYGLSSQVKRVAFLEDFTIVAKKERGQYNQHTQEISEALIQEMKERKLLASIYIKGMWGIVFFMISKWTLLILAPAVAIFALPVGLVARILVALFTILLLVGTMYIFPDFSNIYIPLSPKGQRAATNLRPLKRWLEDFTLLKEKDVLSAKVWKEYIAYASAFGLPAHVYHDLSQLVEDNDDVFKLLTDTLHTTVVE